MARPRRITDEDVLDAARRVIFRTGPADFTLAAVGAESGLAPSTLVLRFGDKRGLLLRALAQDNSDFAALLDAAPSGRGREAVIGLLMRLTPELDTPEDLVAGLLWLREDFRDPVLNALARERWTLLRAAIVARLPPDVPSTASVSAEMTARLLEAQWQGAFNQWGFFHEGRLRDYVEEALRAWFDLLAPPRT